MSIIHGISTDRLNEVHVFVIEISGNSLLASQGTQIRYGNGIVIVHQEFLGFLPHVPGYASAHDVALSLFGILVSQASDRHNRSLGSIDDVTHSDLGSVSREHISTARPASALEQAGLQELVKNLFQIPLRNLLPPGNIFDLCWLAAAVIGHVKKGANPVSARSSNPHIDIPQKTILIWTISLITYN
jgi:hypothetical protein